MSSEQAGADRLHEAVEALLRGRAVDEVARELGVEERALLRAAGRISSARTGSADVPRPTFVLGLEEQLRTDLALAGWPLGRVARLRLALRGRVTPALLVVAAIALLWGAARYDGGAAAPSPDPPDGASASVGPPSAGPTAADRLALGREALGALRAALDGPPDEVRGRIARVVEAYGEAMRLADAGADRGLRDRVADETAMAARAMEDMAAEAADRGYPTAVWLAHAATVMQRRIAAYGGPQRAYAPPSTATETGDAAVATEPPPAATPARTSPPDPPATDTPVPAPSASVTQPVAEPVVTAGTTATPLPVLEPPETAIAPAATATPAAQTTPRPVVTAPVEPTNTPDRWPATSTPLPRPTERPTGLPPTAPPPTPET